MGDTKDMELTRYQALDIAVELCVFVKTHEYPKEMSEDFFELMGLFSKLEGKLREARIVNNDTFKNSV